MQVVLRENHGRFHTFTAAGLWTIRRNTIAASLCETL